MRLISNDNTEYLIAIGQLGHTEVCYPPITLIIIWLMELNPILMFNLSLRCLSHQVEICSEVIQLFHNFLC